MDVKIDKERKILITNKTFMDYSKDIFSDIIDEHKKAPVEVKALVAALSARITGEFYIRLFDISLDDDLTIEGGDEK